MIASSIRVEVDARLRVERAGVGVGVVRAVDVVGEAAALAHLEEEARRHARAEHGREQLQRVAVGMLERQARHADADLRLVGRPSGARATCGPVAVRQLGRRRGSRGRSPGSRRTCSSSVGDQILADHAADADDHAVGRVPLFDVVDERVAVRAADRVLRAERLPAERVVAEHEPLVHRADVVARRVEVHVHLLEDHALLALDLLGVELRVADHVDEHVERGVAVGAGATDVVARVLLRGEGVELAADPVDEGRESRELGRRSVPLKNMCSAKWAMPRLLCSS